MISCFLIFLDLIIFLSLSNKAYNESVYTAGAISHIIAIYLFAPILIPVSGV